MGTRKKEITLLSTLFCFLVITIHLLSDAMTRLDKGSWQYIVAFIPWETASCAVYGFIYISAMKLSMAEYPGYLRFISRRFQKIILPYLTAVTIFWIYFVMSSGYGISMDQVFRYYVMGKIFSHFYFVVIIAQFYLLFPVWRWLTDKAGAVIVLPMALLVMIAFRESFRVLLSKLAPSYSLQYQDRFFVTYLAFWLAGFYSGKHYTEFIRIIKKNTRGILIFFGAVLIANHYFTYLGMAQGVWHQTLTSVNITYCFSAILAAYALMLKAADTAIGANRFLIFISEESYIIYLYHMLALLIINMIMEKVGVTSVSWTFILRGVFVCTVTFIGCLIARNIRSRLNRQSR